MWRLGAMGAGHFPIILAIVMTIMLGLTYVLAVYRGDVSPWFPYISSTGARRPESCVFGELMTIGAFLGLITIYLRFRLVRELNRDADRHLTNMNRAALFLGILSIFGLTLVANFQETAVLPVHLTGAFTLFGCGVLYTIVHSVITFRMHPLYNGIRIARIRALFSIICTVSFLTSVASGGIAGRKYKEAYGHSPPHMFFHKGQAGWEWHIASTISEWILAISFGIFLTSYSRDLEKIKLSVTVEPLVQHLDESPVLQRTPHSASPLPPIIS